MHLLPLPFEHCASALQRPPVGPPSALAASRGRRSRSRVGDGNRRRPGVFEADARVGLGGAGGQALECATGERAAGAGRATAAVAAARGRIHRVFGEALASLTCTRTRVRSPPTYSTHRTPGTSAGRDRSGSRRARRPRRRSSMPSKRRFMVSSPPSCAPPPESSGGTPGVSNSFQPLRNSSNACAPGRGDLRRAPTRTARSDAAKSAPFGPAAVRPRAPSRATCARAFTSTPSADVSPGPTRLPQPAPRRDARETIRRRARESTPMECAC